jgi:DNA modification methylase
MYTDPKDFLNKVYFGDVMELLRQLPDQSVDMIYSDPDYNVGVKYGDKSYSVSFDKYIEWYIELCKESLRVLKDDGNMFLINYSKQNAHLRVKYLDDVCHEVLDYSWVYNSNIGHSPKRFTTAHRSILHCRKTENNRFYKNNVAVPYQNPTDKRIRQNLAKGSLGRMPYDWFYFDLVKNVSKEKTFHACQIPQEMAEMLIKASTLPGDVVLIHFGGSGSEIDVCRRLERNFVAAEIDSKYYRMIMDRLSSGRIDEKYKLNFHKRDTASQQLRLMESKGRYTTPKSKKKPAMVIGK